MNNRKMPGWRWCFSILNMMERQSELRIWHRRRKSNLLTVAVLNKCQSENAASLFKSIRGLGLTVSGGRSPLLWGWGDFFFSYQSSFDPNQVTSLQATFSCHNNQRIWKYVWICGKTPCFRITRLSQSNKSKHSRSDKLCQLMWIWFWWRILILMFNLNYFSFLITHLVFTHGLGMHL